MFKKASQQLPPPTIELNRKEWVCTNKHLETKYIMLNGKLHPTILNNCNEYQRK